MLQPSSAQLRHRQNRAVGKWEIHRVSSWKAHNWRCHTLNVLSFVELELQSLSLCNVHHRYWRIKEVYNCSLHVSIQSERPHTINITNVYVNKSFLFAIHNSKEMSLGHLVKQSQRASRITYGANGSWRLSLNILQSMCTYVYKNYTNAYKQTKKRQLQQQLPVLLMTTCCFCCCEHITRWCLAAIAHSVNALLFAECYIIALILLATVLVRVCYYITST